MSLEDIQRDVDKWTSQYTPQYWPPLEILGAMTEETGEIAREVLHLYGTKKKKSSEDTKDLGQELVNLIFNLSCMANSHNINLQKEWDRMLLERLYSRDKDRYKKV